MLPTTNSFPGPAPAESSSMTNYLGDISYGDLEALINARALANRNANPLSSFANLPPPSGPPGGDAGVPMASLPSGQQQPSRAAMASALFQQEQQALQNRQNQLLGLLRLEQQQQQQQQQQRPLVPQAGGLDLDASGRFKMQGGNPGMPNHPQFNPLMQAAQQNPMAAAGFGIPGMFAKDMALPSSPKQPGRKASFPRKLYKMLMDLEANNSDVAMFVENGRAFAILNPQKFTEEVLPKYFSMKHYASFQRQLNLYKFKRVLEEGPYHGCYYHKMFTKGNPSLIPLIKRQAKPKTKKSKPAPGAKEESDEEASAAAASNNGCK